jgi:hypothetical protein
MKKNERRHTSHTNAEKVMAILTKVNEIYATIHRLVKVHLAGIVLKNHRHTSIEANCYSFVLLEKNGHTCPKIRKSKNDLCTCTIMYVL